MSGPPHLACVPLAFWNLTAKFDLSPDLSAVWPQSPDYRCALTEGCCHFSLEDWSSLKKKKKKNPATTSWINKWGRATKKDFRINLKKKTDYFFFFKKLMRQFEWALCLCVCVTCGEYPIMWIGFYFTSVNLWFTMNMCGLPMRHLLFIPPPHCRTINLDYKPL